MFARRRIYVFAGTIDTPAKLHKSVTEISRASE